MAFLGQICSCKGIEIDPKKTDVVKSFPKHLPPSDIRSFSHFSGYYRTFVKGSLLSPVQ